MRLMFTCCVGARLLAQYQNLSEGADHVGGQLRGDKECPVFSVVTKSGRVWRKVPESDAQSVGQKYWFTTSFLQRCRQAMIGVWASPCAACHISVLRRCHFIPVKVPESDARSVGSWQNQRRGCCGSQELLRQGGKRWKVSRKTKREREELLFCRR